MKVSSGAACALAFCLLVIATCSAQTPAGVELSVQSSVLKNVVAKVIPALEKFLLNLNIPNQSGKYGIPIIGQLKYNVDNIKITKADFSDTTLSTTSAGLQLAVMNGEGQIDADWSWSLRSILGDGSGSGTATIKTSDVAITLVIAFGELNERATASAATNSVDLGKFSIHLTSSNLPNWLLNVIEDIFNDDIKKAIQSDLQSAFASEVSKLNSELQGENVMVPVGTPIQGVGNDLGINLGISKPPVFTTSYFSIPWIGQFYPENNPTLTPPYTPASMPDNVNSETFNVLVNEYLFNTLGWALFKEDTLDTFFKSNTTEWKPVIPNLNKDYPGYLLNVTVEASSAPVANLSTEGFVFSSEFNLDFYPLATNGTSEGDVLTLSLTVDATVELSLNSSTNGTLLTGHISDLKIKVDVVNSAIGHVDTSLLNAALTTVVKTVIIPTFNKVFGQGIPINIPGGFPVSQVTVQYYDGYLVIPAQLQL